MMMGLYLRFLSPSTTATTTLILELSYFFHLATSARSSIGTNGAYSEIGLRDTPPACSPEYGFPKLADCLEALDYMTEDVVPARYDWHGLNALGNVHNVFGIQAREYRAAGDRRQRRFPGYEVVELPRAWSSGTCIVAVRLKSANWQPDLSNWSDILADRLPLLKDNCVVSGRDQGTGGTSLTGEHNGVRLEIYGPSSSLKSYPILQKLCGSTPSSGPTSPHSCNTVVSKLQDVTAALTQALDSLWNTAQDAAVGPLGDNIAKGGEEACRDNMYTLDARKVCEGFMYELIDMNEGVGKSRKGGWDVLFGVGKGSLLGKFGEVFLLVSAEGWTDGGVDEFVPSSSPKRLGRRAEETG